MKLTNSPKHKPPSPVGAPKKSNHSQGEAASRTKIARNNDGQLVRLKRVRRKRETQAPAELTNPNPTLNQVYGSDRVQMTSELGKPAPVQTKPNAVGTKKNRYRSLTPGLNGLVKKANPMPPYRSPMTSFETVL